MTAKDSTVKCFAQLLLRSWLFLYLYVLIGFCKSSHSAWLHVLQSYDLTMLLLSIFANVNKNKINCYSTVISRENLALRSFFCNRHLLTETQDRQTSSSADSILRLIHHDLRRLPYPHSHTTKHSTHFHQIKPSSTDIIGGFSQPRWPPISGQEWNAARFYVPLSTK